MPTSLKTPAREKNGVGVLHKTLDIIEILKQCRQGTRLADVARDVELPKATVYRILMTLEGRGYLDRGGNGSYRLGKKFFDLRRDVPIEELVNRAAQGPMKQLVESSRETVNLGILDAGEVVVISTLESPQALRMASKVGNRRHLHTTALGKVMLSGMSDSEVLRLIRMKGLPSLTPNSITTKVGLAAELRRIREQGYAVDNQENEMEGRCVGAPIRNGDGDVLAALSVSGPVFRMDDVRLGAITTKLLEACAAISRAIE